MSKAAGVALALASLFLFACGHANATKGQNAAKEGAKTSQEATAHKGGSSMSMSTMTGGTAMTALPGGANKVCPVTGNPVKSTLFYEYHGKKIYLCSPNCLIKVKADPAKYFAKAYPELAKADAGK